MTGIGVLREGPLHASIKDWCARPGDRAEVRIERWVIDLVRADGELVEVQTGGFGPLGPKLDALLDGHRMRIVHPVPAERERTPAQVVLRWHVQLGHVVIPKSVTQSRIEENLGIFDFHLTDDDMAAIETLDRGERTGPDPDTFIAPPAP